jgi:hypothetical protein
MAWYDDFTRYVGFTHSASSTVVKSIGDDVVDAIDYMNKPIDELLTEYQHLYLLYLDGVRASAAKYEKNLSKALQDPKFIIAITASIATGQWWAVAALLVDAGLTGEVDDTWALAISNSMNGRYSPKEIKFVNDVLNDPAQGLLSQAQIETNQRMQEEADNRAAQAQLDARETERAQDSADIEVNNSLLPVENTIVHVTQQTVTPIAQPIGLASDLYDETVGDLQEWLTNTLKSGVNLMNGYTIGVFNFISDKIGKALDTFTVLGNTIEQTFGDMLHAVTTQVTSLTAGTVNAISSILGTVSDTLDDFVSPLYGEINDTLDALHDTTLAEINRAKFYSDKLLEDVDAVVSGVITSVENIPLAIRETFANVGDGIKDAFMLPIEQIGKFFVEGALEYLTSSEVSKPTITAGESYPLNEMSQLSARFWGELSNSGFALTGQNNPMGGIVALLLYAGTFVKSILAALDYETQGAMQNYKKTRPLELPPPTESLELYRRGTLDRNAFLDIMARHGFPTSYAEMFATLTDKIPPEGELITWYLRGIITENNFDQLLKQAGWIQPDIAALKEGIYGIPPVQDLVTMAVREAFSPDVISTYRTMEDYPQAFGEYTKQQGISEEWAKRYWIAHWTLPSLEMGYEMLHRGVITDGELDLLMRTQDVMPYWRDKLKQISYNPLTRVDVRRMFDMGILSYDEVVRAYKDIGYNEENAQRLAQFTQQLATSNDEDETQTVKELTKSDVLQAYEDGTIKRDNAETMLKGIGYSIEATSIFLDAVDRKVKREELHALADLAEAQYTAGVIDFNELQDALNSLGLSETEKRKRLLTVQHKEIKTDKIPSLSDLNKMLAIRAVDANIYRQTAKMIGYSDFWIDKYLLIAEGQNE